MKFNLQQINSNCKIVVQYFYLLQMSLNARITQMKKEKGKTTTRKKITNFCISTPNSN